MSRTVEFYGRIVNDCANHGPTSHELDENGLCEVCKSPAIRAAFAAYRAELEREEERGAGS